MKALLHRTIDSLQAQFPPNRIVVLLGGLTTALSATFSAWLATQFPGVEFPVEVIAGAFLLGLGGSVAVLHKWVDGQQRQEDREHEGLLEAKVSERFEAEAKLRAAEPESEEDSDDPDAEE